MPGNIFVNYRRGDDPGFTQALYLLLEDNFPVNSLFMDVEGHISPGDDFVEVLNTQVALCDVLLAVIGPRWLDSVDDIGRSRLENPEDFVRIEIASALDQGKRVIPVLVGGADIPREEQLPDPIKSLAGKQMVRLTPERFRSDCQGLIVQLKKAIEDAEAEEQVRKQSAAFDDVGEQSLVSRYDYSNPDALDPRQRVLPETDGAIWIDYVADVGDGFDSTYSIAYLLSQPQLSVRGCDSALPTGQILIMGGDKCYPYASIDGYMRRLIDVFRCTTQHASNDPELKRKLFLLPGSLDWHDGLSAFTQLFCQRRDGDSPGIPIGSV